MIVTLLQMFEDDSNSLSNVRTNAVLYGFMTRLLREVTSNQHGWMAKNNNLEGEERRNRFEEIMGFSRTLCFGERVV